MKITIKNEEVEIKNTMRAYLIFEELSNQEFRINSLLEILIYFYSIILANKKDIDLTFEEFVDYMDEHTEVLDEFKNWLITENEKAQLFRKTTEGDTKKK